MNRLLLAALATSLSVGFASAADMPAKAPGKAKAVPVAFAYNWSGFYIGAHGGGAWGDSDWTLVSVAGAVPDRTVGLAGANPSHDIDGWLGGVQAGWNYQMQQWVFGIEVSWSGGSIDGTSNSTAGALDDVFTTKVDSIFLASGRLGYAWDRMLLYGKAGFASADVRVATSDTVGVAGSASSEDRQSGYVLGAGLEHAFAPNWILGAEYNYIDLGDNRHTQTFSGAGGTTVDDVSVKLHTLVARVSYKF